LFHQGLPERSQLLTADGRAWLARIELPTVARQAVELALRMIDQLEGELDRLDTDLAGIARSQPIPYRHPAVSLAGVKVVVHTALRPPHLDPSSGPPRPANSEDPTISP
jgi:hypothetical protein